MEQRSSYSNMHIPKKYVDVYIRMVLMTVVSLYTSRGILDWGDFGLYYIVEVIFILFLFINNVNDYL